MEETYELDSFLVSTLELLFQRQATYIVEVIQTVNKLKELPELELDITTLDLETELLDMFYNTEDHMDNLKDQTELKIKEAFDNYLKTIGIDFEYMSFYNYKEIFSTIYTIYDLDIEAAEYFVNILNAEYTNDEEHTVDILSEFCNISQIELMELVEEVNPNYVDDLRYYFNRKSFLQNEDVDEEVQEIVTRLISTNELFANSKIVIEALNHGYIKMPFEYNREKLYNNLYSMQDNVHLVPYEIAATILLSSDTNDNLTEFFRENVDLNLLPYLENNTNLYSYVDEEVRKLLLASHMKG